MTTDNEREPENEHGIVRVSAKKPAQPKRARKLPVAAPVLAGLPPHLTLQPLWSPEIDIDESSDEARKVTCERLAQLMHRMREVSEARPDDERTRHMATVLQAVLLADREDPEWLGAIAKKAEGQLPQLGAPTKARTRAEAIADLDRLVTRWRAGGYDSVDPKKSGPGNGWDHAKWLAYQFVCSPFASDSCFSAEFRERFSKIDRESTRAALAACFTALRQRDESPPAYLREGLAIVGMSKAEIESALNVVYKRRIREHERNLRDRSRNI